MKKYLLTFLSLLTLSQAPCLGRALQYTEVGASYTAGRFITIDQGYGQVGLFVPLTICPYFTPFVDGRGYLFNNGKWAGSAGLGVRALISNGSALGINAYYDYRRGTSKNNFHQVGVGLEWLNGCWDVRANGYLPVWRNTQSTAVCKFHDIGEGPFHATRFNKEWAYSGFDAEIGISSPDWCNFSLYGAAGPYYFARKQHHSFWGGFARIELNWFSILSIQGRFSYDRFNKAKVQGIFAIVLPFDLLCKPLCEQDCTCEGLLTQRVQRFGIIQTDDCCNWKWNW